MQKARGELVMPDLDLGDIAPRPQRLRRVLFLRANPYRAEAA
jgi:hypothetical protein